jgi:opacity protein-like surface antigen
MFVVSTRSAFAVGFIVGVAALCLGGHSVHAQQATAVPYLTSGWSSGFRGGQSADQGANAYGNVAGFAGGNAGSGEPFSRYNFSNGFFVGSERGGLGLGGSGFNRFGAFGNSSAFSYEGVQLGYDFKNAPVSVYAGFDTLKYNPGHGGPFAPFDSTSGTVPGYSARAGVEFRPTSNLSLSLGASFTQPGDGNSLALPGAPPIGIVPRR